MSIGRVGAKTARLTVGFNAHVARERVQSMISGIAAYGSVTTAESGLEIEVEVFRRSKLPELERRLVELDRRGVLRWSRLDHDSG